MSEGLWLQHQRGAQEATGAPSPQMRTFGLIKLFFPHVLLSLGTFYRGVFAQEKK